MYFVTSADFSEYLVVHKVPANVNVSLSTSVEEYTRFLSSPTVTLLDREVSISCGNGSDMKAV